MKGARDLALLVGLRAAGVVVALAAGFSHVSDDDYARTVIAEGFAHAPRLDPSGTSWLPVPFWLMGAAMTCLGRSLEIARGASIVLALASLVPLHASLRHAGLSRGGTLLGLAFTILSPWSVWTSAATVPEAFTSALSAAAVFFAVAPPPATSGGPPGLAPLASGLLLTLACLSRYEPWPLAPLLASVWLVRAWRERDRLALVGAALCLLGPATWMAWNVHAHGSATHFLARVARYRQSLGEPSLGLADRVLAYPSLLLVHFPESAVFGALGVVGLLTDRLPRRLGIVLAAALGIVAFLAYGNVRDGAPTHHAERTLLPVATLLAPLGAEVLLAWVLPGKPRTVAPALLLGLAWLAGAGARWSEMPGRGDDDRGSIVARGRAIRERGAPRLEITPCNYEHFALIAAFGAPERVTIRPSQRIPLHPRCPEVRELPP